MDHSPRSAAVLCARAIGLLHLVQPEGLREPMRLAFTACIEQCSVSRSLLGHPLVATLQMAQVLVDVADPP